MSKVEIRPNEVGQDIFVDGIKQEGVYGYEITSFVGHPSTVTLWIHAGIDIVVDGEVFIVQEEGIKEDE